MSEKVIINGKEYAINVSYGKFIESMRRREKYPKLSNPEHLIMDLWDYLERVRVFKPFVFRFRLKNKVSLNEMLEIDKKIGSIISVEGREPGN